MPINFYQGPGQLYSTRDTVQSNPFTSTLSRLTQERSDEQSQQNLAQMAAERMRGLGPQGAQWAQMIERDPRAALSMMAQYGGPAEIENSILGARAQGEAAGQWSRALGSSELTGPELEIMRMAGPEKGPAALKAYRDAQAGPEAAEGPASYTTNDGVWIRDPNAPGGYRNAGPPKQSGGLQMELDENGRLVGFSMGGGGMTNTSRSKVEEKALNAQGMLSRLDQIRDSFDPKFQTWGGKVRIAAIQAKASSGLDVSSDEQKQLEDVARFKVAAFNNMNRVLNELSGAAISPQEAERLKQELPNPGTGLFDGDDPITFKAKMDAVDNQIREAIRLYDTQLQRGENAPDDSSTQSRSESTSAPKPLPPRDQLVEGEVYETSKGAARWNGASFSLVK